MNTLTSENWHQWLDLKHWLGPLPDGSQVLLDPASAARLDPNRPHQWLEEDDRLREGFMFLGRQGIRTQVTIAYGRHNEAEDLGDPNKHWFEDQLGSHDAFAFESLGWSGKDMYEQFLGAIRTHGASQIKNPFHRRLLTAAAYSDTPSFSYDIEKTDRGLDKLIIAMCETYAPNERTEPKNPPVAELAEWMVVSSAIREWYMVGKLGRELSDIPSGTSGGHSVLMTVGGAHRDLTRKLRSFNVMVSPKLIRPQFAGSGAGERMARFLRNSEVSFGKRFV